MEFNIGAGNYVVD